MKNSQVLFWIVFLLCHLLIESEQQRLPCWTRNKCDQCTRKSRVGRMPICCNNCAVGKVTVRVTKSKVYCWCTV